MDENLNAVEMENEITNLDMSTDVDRTSNDGPTAGQIVGAGIGLMAGTALFNCLFIDVYSFAKKQIIKGGSAAKKAITEKVDKVKMKKKLDKEIEAKEESKKETETKNN